MTKQILIGIAGFLAFSITGIAAASAIEHPDIPLTTQAKTAVEQITGLNLGTKNSEHESVEVDDDSVTRHSSTINAVSDDEQLQDEDDDRGGRGSEREDEDDDRGGSRGTTTVSPPVPTSATFTLAQVAQHNSISSCYTAINGSVYDVTSWISQHPGGSGAIKSLCGIDGSAAFDGQHGGQSRPVSELAGFKIGILKP